MRQCYNYGCHRHRADSALLCFSIVADRYSRHLSREEKLRCIEALNMQYLIFSTSLFDYAKSYKCLNIRTAPFPCVLQSLLLRLRFIGFRKSLSMLPMSGLYHARAATFPVIRLHTSAFFPIFVREEQSLNKNRVVL